MRWIVVAAVAVIALAVGLGLRKPERAGARATQESTAATAPSDESAPTATETDEQEREPDAEGEEEFPTVEIRGTLVLVEEGGRPLASESGTFQLDADYRRDTIEVTDGAWRAEVPAGSTLSFEKVVLGGRNAIASPTTAEIPPDGLVEVRCRWFVPARLRVISEKGEDLEGVQIAARESDEIVPVNDAEVIECGASPVTVAGEEAGVQQYWVRASGHAWTRVSLWQGDGSERIVRLVRAGALEARIVPFDAETEVALHVWRAGAYVLGWSPDESGLCRIEGLPPGRLELRAATGYVWNERVYATTTVEIEPGKIAQATLPLHEAARAAETVRVEGTLHVHPAWPEPAAGGFCGLGSGVPRIEVDGGTGGEVALDEDGAWSAELTPGRHVFSASPWMWTQVIEVAPSGTTGARLVVPPPCDVEVRLVDAATGDPIADNDDLWWYVTSGHIDWQLVDMERLPCAEPGVWRFQAPIGTLVVSLWNKLHDAEAMETDLKAGKNRVELKAVPNYSCAIALTDGAVPVPIDEEIGAGVRAAALVGSGSLAECGTGHPCSVWFTEAGRYRLTLPAIEGYEPVEPIEIEIAAGTIPLVEVALKQR